MKFVEKQVQHGKDENKKPIYFPGPIAVFESTEEAVEILGASQALAILNGQADIKCRAKHRLVYATAVKAGNEGVAASEEAVMSSLKAVGTTSRGNKYGIPSGELSKVTKRIGTLFANGDIDGATKLRDDFEANPKDTLASLYEQGILHKRASKTDEAAN